jgi:hypothetical protein
MPSTVGLEYEFRWLYIQVFLTIPHDVGKIQLPACGAGLRHAPHTWFPSEFSVSSYVYAAPG